MIPDLDPDRDPDPSAILDALGHPIRRYVLALLEFGGATAGDLTASIGADFGLSRTRAHHHLRALRDADLVDVVGDGNLRWYALNNGAAAPLTAWLRRLRLSD